jgi:type I restriction enzyme S subunit
VCDLLNGRAYKQNELLEQGKYPVLRVGNFFTNRGWYYSNLELDPDKYCDNGDLLYAWSASFGPKIWDGSKVIYHYHIWKTRPEQRAIEKRLLFYWFDWDKENIKAEHGTGSTMIHVTKGDMESRPIPLPPLSEQRRIVANIDRLRTRTARAHHELDLVPRLIQRYKQAILAKAFSGELTADWRASQGLANDWSTTTIGKLLNAIIAGKNLRCEERPPTTNERGVIKVSAVTWGRFDATQAKTLPYDFDPPARTRICQGDFLISRANTLELVGAVAIVDVDPINLYLSDKVLRLDMDDDSKPWLLWFLRSTAGRSAIESGATGNQVSMRNLSQEALKAIELPWPATSERSEILRRIMHASAWLDKIAIEQTRTQHLLPKLDQAILAKAFRGQLVPQDPNDEPASALLKRIHAERDTEPGARRRGRRSQN